MTTATSTFLQTYVREIAANLGNDHADNHDHTRFGPEVVAPDHDSWVRRRYRRYLTERRLQLLDQTALQFEHAIDLVAPHLAAFETLYTQLGDEASRRCLVQVLAFRALGHRKVKLPLSTPEFWAGLRRVEALASPTDRISPRFLDWSLSLISVHELGFPVALYTLPMAAYVQFALRQYLCDTPRGPIGAIAPGACVIDGGACWGDTALLFSHLAGASGRVFSFEFVPGNLEIFRRNLALNPELQNRVAIVEHALWSKSGETIGYDPNGPGTKIAPGAASEQATAVTLSIDDLVATRELSRVDFIKLDIEGAELPTLQGAEQTLRRFQPDLAIAVYHSLEDFHAIPRYLASLGLGYRFYLRHFTVHAEETMLFASAR